MKKILVIRVGRSGDIVMITPALQALLKKYPDAEIDVLTSPDGKRILNGFNPGLKVAYIHERKSVLENFTRRQFIKQIAAQNYDAVYCFELNPSFKQFYEKTRAEIFQLQYDKGVRNYALYCLELVRGDISPNMEHEWIWLPVTEDGKQKTNALLNAADISDDSIVVGLHPSFSGLRKSFLRSSVHRNEKLWPAEYFGRLAQKLDAYAKQSGIKLEIIMDLVEDDRELGEAIVSASQGIVKLFVPALDFERYKATLARMHILVVPNTGPMHIAGAVGTNLVALFGGISPDDSSAYVPEHQYQYLCVDKAMFAEKGLAAISPEQVYQACLKFLPNTIQN